MNFLAKLVFPLFCILLDLSQESDLQRTRGLGCAFWGGGRSWRICGHKLKPTITGQCCGGGALQTPCRGEFSNRFTQV